MKALFPGSFDPFHEGHYQLLLKAQKLFEEVIIFIGNNDKKNSSSFKERYLQVTNFLKLKNNSCQVVYGNELTIDIAKKYHCSYLIRGLRTSDDFKYEYELFQINKKLNNQIETIYFTVEESYLNYKSSNLK